MIDSSLQSTDHLLSVHISPYKKDIYKHRIVLLFEPQLPSVSRNTIKAMPDIDTVFLPSSSTPETKLILVECHPSHDYFSYKFDVRTKGAEEWEGYMIHKWIKNQWKEEEHGKKSRSLYFDSRNYELGQQQSLLMSRIKKLGEENQPLQGFSIGLITTRHPFESHTSLNELQNVTEMQPPIVFAGIWDYEKSKPRIKYFSCKFTQQLVLTEKMADTIKQTFFEAFTPDDLAGLEHLATQTTPSQRDQLEDALRRKMSAYISSLRGSGTLIGFDLIHCNNAQELEFIKCRMDSMMPNSETPAMHRTHLSLQYDPYERNDALRSFRLLNFSKDCQHCIESDDSEHEITDESDQT